MNEKYVHAVIVAIAVIAIFTAAIFASSNGTDFRAVIAGGAIAFLCGVALGESPRESHPLIFDGEIIDEEKKEEKDE